MANGDGFRKWLEEKHGIVNPILLQYGKSLHEMTQGFDCCNAVEEYLEEKLAEVRQAFAEMKAYRHYHVNEGTAPYIERIGKAIEA